MDPQLLMLAGVVLFTTALLTRTLYPPLVLFLYILIAPEETLGTGCAFMEMLGRDKILQLLRAAMIIATVVSLHRLFLQQHDFKYGRRPYSLGLMLSFCAAWMLLSGFIMSATSFDNFLSKYLLINGPCASIIALAYYKDRFAKNLFLTLILTQVILSILLIKLPGSPLDIFSASNYTKYTLEMQHGMDIIGSRASGQFQNTVQLSYYSAISVIVGIFLLQGRKHISDSFLGLLFIFAGIWLQLITVTRAIMMGLVFGFAFASFNAKKGFSRFVSIICLVVMVMIFVSSMYPESFGKILETARFKEVSDDLSSQSYRYLALEAGINAIAIKPVFGYGGLGVLDDCFEYVCHLEPIRLAMAYGLPVGICSFVLIIIGLFEDFISKISEFRKKSVMPKESINALHAHTMAVWVTVFMVMTNALGGRVLSWMVLAMTSVSWAEFNNPERSAGNRGY